MTRSFVDRCDDTYQLGLNRQQRRDRARATRQQSSPRGRGPTPPAVLALAMRLREHNSHALDDQQQVPDDGARSILPGSGGESLGRSRGALRRLSRLGRLPGLRK